MRDKPNPASCMSLVALVDLAGLEIHSPEDLAVQVRHDVVFHNLLDFPGVQVDILDRLQVGSQVDTANPVGKEGTECLDTQGGMILCSK